MTVSKFLPLTFSNTSKSIAYSTFAFKSLNCAYKRKKKEGNYASVIKKEKSYSLLD